MIALNNRYPQVKPGLQMALDDGVLNALEPELNETFSECDIIFLCAPVIVNTSYLPRLKEIMKPDCILTDVGSVKGNIHEAVEQAGLASHFIGGHPMAGTEKTGYENSTDTMLQGAFYLLTPTAETTEEQLCTLKEITAMCGCKTLTLTPKEHDIAAAAISHVPHILSYSLVNTVQERDNEQQYMKQFAAGGFRDMTRIAASSPEMWQNIVQSNKTAVLTFLSQYQMVLEEFKQMLINDDTDGILQFFQKSKDYRDTF
jgi:prephenate dehydrogenase